MSVPSIYKLADSWAAQTPCMGPVCTKWQIPVTKHATGMLENVYELSVHGIYMYIHVITVYIQDSECICHVYTCLYHSIRQDSLKMYMSCLYMVHTCIYVLLQCI